MNESWPAYKWSKDVKMCNMTKLWCGNICDNTHSYVPWLIYMCNDPFICADLFICAMTHSYSPWLIHMRHDSIICAMTHLYVPWLISESNFSKTAIFPETRKGNLHISNESARGWTLREAKVDVNLKGAPHDGQDKVKTLRTIIWYKRACIRQMTQQLSLAVPTS